MTEVEKLQQNVLYGQAVGFGLSAVMTSLVSELVSVKGGDLEASMIEARALLDKSLSTFVVKGTAESGGEHDISPEIRRRIGLLLDAVEGNARKELGLSPPVKERH